MDYMRQCMYNTSLVPLVLITVIWWKTPNNCYLVLLMGNSVLSDAVLPSSLQHAEYCFQILTHTTITMRKTSPAKCLSSHYLDSLLLYLKAPNVW